MQSAHISPPSVSFSTSVSHAQRTRCPGGPAPWLSCGSRAYSQPQPPGDRQDLNWSSGDGRHREAHAGGTQAAAGGKCVPSRETNDLADVRKGGRSGLGIPVGAPVHPYVTRLSVRLFSFTELTLAVPVSQGSWVPGLQGLEPPADPPPSARRSGMAETPLLSSPALQTLRARPRGEHSHLEPPAPHHKQVQRERGPVPSGPAHGCQRGQGCASAIEDGPRRPDQGADLALDQNTCQPP